MIEFLREHGARRINSAVMDDRRTVTPGAILDYGNAGLFGLQVEQEFGGQQLSYRDAWRVIEQAAAIDLNLGLVVGVHNAVGVTPIRRFADPRVKSAVLPLLATGRSLATIASSEPGAGSHVRAIATTARRTADGYVVDGTKAWTSLGSWAGHITLLARLVDEDGRRRGITAFLVEGRSEGFTPRHEAATMGMRGLPQNTIDINGLRLRRADLLGPEGAGMKVGECAFHAGRGLLSAGSVGVMKRCLQLAGRYVLRRSVATGRLIENGRVQQILSDCQAATRAVEILVGHLAAELDAGREVPDEVYSTCKIVSSELAFQVADWCVQLMGARGYLDTNQVAQIFRDIRLLRIFEGSTELLTMHLGSRLGRAPGVLEDLLVTDFDGQATLETVERAHREVSGGFPRQSTGPAAQRNGQILASLGGEIACWALLSAAVARTARRTGTELDQYTDQWARHQLADRIRRASDRQRQFGILGADSLTDGLHAYQRSIGDVTPSLPGLDWESDVLLRRS
ncbi:acyl-CoA dehydrogenase family protein [Streptomyces sp. AP-93]|uniref:acyl-CoA dehydrogenase family protein n=1 Tax=Streptomyces sp. AP-93 TaxID=2929048 RepID=UPI00243521E7|nr:acyl-CoA dehydrogenase family protein [Streptomyces sp. AP-93]